MGLANLNELSATDLTDKILRGVASSVEVTRACLDRIEATDDQLKAWAHLDPDFALKQAADLDHMRKAGRPVGTLHGLPVGVKDIIDTRDWPTEFGSPAFAGRKPEVNATVIDRLLEAGAVIMGKTVTTEFATMHPAATTNPHNPARSPGGSSSGSAAAVAAFQVPLAIGSQTNGSVIRPGSFCGIFGFKPTFGVVSRRGMLRTSATLDHVGVFGRTLEDIALLTDAVACFDPADLGSYPRPRPHMAGGVGAEVPVEPVFAWFDLPFADRLDEDCLAGLEDIRALLGDRVDVLPSPDVFAELVEVHSTIFEHDIWRELGSIAADKPELVSDVFRELTERGGATTQADYESALEIMAANRRFFDVFFRDYDAIIAPSSPGEAPPTSSGTGDPVFNTIWTLAGLPCVTLPLLTGSHNMPIGLQLIGGREEDDRLLRTANWLLNELKADNGHG